VQGRPFLCPRSSVAEHFHGKEEVPSSILGAGYRCAGVAQLVEQQFCKLLVVGSSPTVSSKQFASVAQLVEYEPSKLAVVGSKPSTRSMRL
jgi:hypothetical protein